MKKEVKRLRDPNQLAKFIVDVVTGEQEPSLEVGPVNEFARTEGLKVALLGQPALAKKDGKKLSERLHLLDGKRR